MFKQRERRGILGLIGRCYALLSGRNTKT